MSNTERKLNLLWVPLIVLPLVSVAAAVGVYLATQNSPVSDIPVTAGPTATIENALVGQMAPNFELEALDGKSVRLSSLRGRVVFVNFWATWCEPCKREFPAFQEFATLDNNAVILAVNEGETAEQIQSFLDEVGIDSVPVLLDGDFRVGDEYETDYFPSTFVINPAGIVAAFHVGEITLDDLNGYAAEYNVVN